MSDEERELVLEHLRIRYVGQMEYFDDLFEEVLQSMEDEGFLDDTLLVLWTDHGEQFYERDAWGHAFGLYQEETGAVALFNHPEIEPQAWEGPTSHIDIAPTILHYLGIEQPEAITGHVAGTAPDNRVLLQVTSGQKGANLRATVGSLRMDLGYESGRRQAFDYSSDPDEIEDVCDLDASVDAALWTALEGYADTLEPLLVDYRRSATYKGCNGSD
jgi:arylsulfatase A-like enzyme